jgi:S-formylglutathione hydrolase FrmB
MQNRGLVKRAWLGAFAALTLLLIAFGSKLNSESASPTPAAAANPPAAEALATGRVLEPSFRSVALGSDQTYTVYLPPGYDFEADRRYPVLYMLHGLGGSRHDWRDYGLFATADALIRSGAIQPMIIVTPDGQSSYYVDQANGGPRWGTFIARDLVQEVDRAYRTMPGREYRAIGGASMGAHGAFQLAMNSNAFGVVGAHSIALRKFQEALPMFADREHFEAHDPVALCKKYGGRALNIVIAIDIGADDRWLPAATTFHDQLKTAGILHSWTVNPGGHDSQYWGSHLVEYLDYYSQALAMPLPEGAAARSNP